MSVVVPAEGRGARAGLEICWRWWCRRSGMSRCVCNAADAAGDDDVTCEVDQFCGVFNGEILADGGNPPACDADVARVGIHRGDDGAIANDRADPIVPPMAPGVKTTKVHLRLSGE